MQGPAFHEKFIQRRGSDFLIILVRSSYRGQVMFFYQAGSMLPWCRIRGRA